MSTDSPVVEPRMVLPPVTLVLGGIRSGKSRFAESLLEALPHRLYVATGEGLDDEMRARIKAHQQRRGDQWATIETPLDLVSALRKHASPQKAVLVDCLSLWVSNLMMAERMLDDEIAMLVQSLPALGGPVVFVSTEVGLGGISMNQMARRYADVLGTLNQAVGTQAQRVYCVMAGIAMLMKNEETANDANQMTVRQT